MGLLDGFSLDNLFSDDPKRQAMLAMAAGLLGGSGKTNRNFGADLGNAGLLGMQTYGNAQKMERENRASDLQQLSGAYNMLKQQEFGKMLAAKQAGQPYTPNPMLPQMETKLSQLTGLGNLSGKFGLTAPPAQASQPAAAPSLPASQASQYSPVVNPEYQAKGPMPQPQAQRDSSGLGGPAGGIPMEAWLAQDPSGKSYLEQLAKDAQPQNVRPGGSLAVKGPSGKYDTAYFSPQLGPGLQPQRDAQGALSAAPIPGYNAAAAQREAAQAAATAFGKLPYLPPTAIQTKGAPTLMTPAQAIESATGQPPPNPMQVSPAQQGGRNTNQLAILRSELARAASPQDRAAIQTEIAALQGAQQRGDPFSSQKPVGLELQDQGAGAAQRELGQQIGSQAADTFKTGAASVQAKKQLSLMSDMAKSYTPGMFQPLKSKLAQYAMTIPGVSEDFSNKILNTNAGDIQALTSAAITMAGKLTRQTDAQPSQLQFLKTLESMPSAERSQQGFAKIMDYLNNAHDYNIEKMIAQQQWLDDPKHQGDPSGFEAAWATKAKTLPFIWNQQQAKADTKEVSFGSTKMQARKAPDGKFYIQSGSKYYEVRD
jgi:hypothetical protein